MPLVRRKGLLLRAPDGALATGCCCNVEPECVYARYQHPIWEIGPEPFAPSDCGQSGVEFVACNFILEQQAIAKPDRFAGRATTVTITGSFDDSIAINGAVIGNCAFAGAVNVTFVLDESRDVFMLGAVDSHGSCAHGNLTICFFAGNPLP